MILVESVVVGLVAYRLWRLLAVDTLLEPLSRWISARGSWGQKFIHKFVACPWCSGFWCCLIVGLAAWGGGLVEASPWLVVPAASVVCGMLGDRL
jgi:hypothetical protein